MWVFINNDCLKWYLVYKAFRCILRICAIFSVKSGFQVWSRIHKRDKAVNHPKPGAIFLHNFSILRLSLLKCWAEKIVTGTTTKPKPITFWDQFCPQYDWVAPEVVADVKTGGKGYLKAVWDRKRAIHHVNFRKLSKFKHFFFIWQSEFGFRVFT